MQTQAVQAVKTHQGETFVLRYVNHGRSHAQPFATIGDALEHARTVGFDAAIDHPTAGCCAGWSGLYGARFYKVADKSVDALIRAAQQQEFARPCPWLDEVPF